jgi:flagellar biosynthetic protein FliO
VCWSQTQPSSANTDLVRQLSCKPKRTRGFTLRLNPAPQRFLHSTGQLLVLWLLGSYSAFGATTSTNLFSSPLPAAGLADTGPSLLRVLGALALVLGLFLGGTWLVRNGRLSGFGRKASARLNVLETRSLGARQAIYVVGYGQERFLIGSTPAGINLLSHLTPTAEPEADGAGHVVEPPSFSQALVQVLRGAKSGSAKTGGKI